MWKKYYWRVIGFFLAGGGGGLIADELVNQTIDFSHIGHEWYGLILLIVGLYLISKKPKGKER